MPSVSPSGKNGTAFREARARWTEHVQPDPLADDEGAKLALAAIGYSLASGTWSGATTWRHGRRGCSTHDRAPPLSW